MTSVLILFGEYASAYYARRRWQAPEPVQRGTSTAATAMNLLWQNGTTRPGHRDQRQRCCANTKRKLLIKHTHFLWEFCHFLNRHLCARAHYYYYMPWPRIVVLYRTVNKWSSSISVLLRKQQCDWRHATHTHTHLAFWPDVNEWNEHAFVNLVFHLHFLPHFKRNTRFTIDIVYNYERGSQPIFRIRNFAQ